MSGEDVFAEPYFPLESTTDTILSYFFENDLPFAPATEKEDRTGSAEDDDFFPSQMDPTAEFLSGFPPSVLDEEATPVFASDLNFTLNSPAPSSSSTSSQSSSSSASSSPASPLDSSPVSSPATTTNYTFPADPVFGHAMPPFTSHSAAGREQLAAPYSSNEMSTSPNSQASPHFRSPVLQDDRFLESSSQGHSRMVISSPSTSPPTSPSSLTAAAGSNRSSKRERSDDDSPSSFPSSFPSSPLAHPDAGKAPSSSSYSASAALSEVGTGVTLPRHILLKITSEEFEAFVNQLTKVRNLNDEELKEIRRQRRLVRNREYAQENRTKKKKASLSTNQQVAELEKENRLLRDENGVLKQEVLRLRTMLNEIAYLQQGGAPAAKLASGSIAPSLPSPPLSSSVSSSSSSSRGNNLFTAKAAAACVFMVFFSFVLFGATPQGPPGLGNQKNLAHRVLLEFTQSAIDFSTPLSNWACNLPLVSRLSLCQNPPLPPPDLPLSSNPEQACNSS